MAQDLLEVAHLEHLRGHDQAARALLIRILACEPANGAAKRLLSILESSSSDSQPITRCNWWVAIPSSILALTSVVWLVLCIRYGLQLGFVTPLNASKFVRGISFEAPVWVFVSLASGATLGCMAVLMKACGMDRQ